MDIGGRKGSRRIWSKEEEDALLNVLDDVVALGQRCDSGQFKSGTLRLIEKKLAKICPGSGLKAQPHIESKLKKWKKQYVIICDMLNKRGFEWNDVSKCVKVGSDEAWLSYVQNNKDARGWRGRYFPLYERLANIFGKDRASQKEAQTPLNVVEENDVDEMNINDNAMDAAASPGQTPFHVENDVHEMNINDNSMDAAASPGQTPLRVVEENDVDEMNIIDNTMDAAASPVSVAQTATTQRTIQSQSSRPYDRFIAGMSEVAGAFIKMLEKHDERLLVLAESLKPKDENYPKFIAEELKRLDVPICDRIKASKALMNVPTNVEILKSLDSDAEKMEFITVLLSDA
ncbi:hypothetical protein FNV43_RR25005 [Rhamnella rubrinervis]|uniref:Myb/SANT-like domain-containing protein n=1 Tax=Rhamnella rubrinervis TaxID=2594499 RepID=A0A8K0GLS0_9ROSA|nr:hypothetical protein FNV43_RR25005 [Rhamnella rubrinervis]